MPFISPNFDDVLGWVTRDLRATIAGAKTVEGSDYWATAVMISNVVLPMYANGAYLAKQGLPDTADTIGLTRWGNILGVAKLGDQRSSGSITVTSTVATTIGDATTLYNPITGARYQSIGATIIGASLSGTMFVRAIDPGAAADAVAGVTLTFESVPPSVNGNATVLSISGGGSAWDNTRWATEILKRLKMKAAAGNIAHVTALATAVSGVEACFVYPALRGAGTLDLVVTTAASSGSRVAGTDILNRVLGALQNGVKPAGGDFIPGIPEDVFANTTVSPVVAQSTDVLIQFTASLANPFAAWPPKGAGFQVPTDATTWYLVASGSGNTVTVTKPTGGTVTAPLATQLIGLYFPDVGYCKTTITSVVDNGASWTLTISGWLSSANAAPAGSPVVGAVIVPWSVELPLIAGAPTSSTTKAVSGALGDYFAGLGPGEMTPLTADDTTRRLRWPRASDTNPITGEAEWPVGVTARLTSLIARRTDAVDLAVNALNAAHAIDATKTNPSIPNASYLGTPPSLLTVGVPFVIPV